MLSQLGNFFIALALSASFIFYLLWHWSLHQSWVLSFYYAPSFSIACRSSIHKWFLWNFRWHFSIDSATKKDSRMGIGCVIDLCLSCQYLHGHYTWGFPGNIYRAALFGYLIDIGFSVGDIAAVSGAYIFVSLLLLFLIRKRLNPTAI